MELVRNEMSDARGGAGVLGGGRYHLDDLLTVEEGAEFMKCHSETIRRGYWFGGLRRVAVGGRGVRIRFRDLLAWIEAGARTKA